MREILFRGKRIDDGEWLYGHYVHQYGADMIYLPDGVDREYGFDYYHIDKETVGQYTGLTDRNGKKIFEGDIIKNIAGHVYCGSYTYTVVWRCGWFCGEGGVVDIQPEYFNCCEVIGNIHDNPELLNKE